jgi:hypothetical protein
MAIRWSILTYNFTPGRDKNPARLSDLAAQFGARHKGSGLARLPPADFTIFE